MLLALVAIVVGLVLLTKAADAFVTGAARLSAALKVPPVIIGAIVVGFGTSAPELVVSAIAAANGKADIAVGNIIGSNVANLSLVLGISALLCVMTVDSTILRREAPLSTAAVVLFAVLVQGGGVTTPEGLVLLVALIGAIGYLFFGPRGNSDDLASEVDEFLDDEEGIKTGAEAVRTLLGLIGVVVGAQLTVTGASDVAERLGLGEGFVGLTLVALGTSLPELMTAIAAARKGEHELIVGNLLGSNLFNSLAVGASVGVLGPDRLTDTELAGTGTVLMLAVAFGAWLFMYTGRRVQRWEGVVLLGVYLVAVPMLA